jgi:hypothetical protein
VIPEVGNYDRRFWFRGGAQIGRWNAAALGLLLILAASAARAEGQGIGSSLGTQPLYAQGETSQQPPQELIADGKILGKRIPTTPGAICVVCNKPIGKTDFTFLVSGQRVPVHRPVCYGALLKNPYRFLAILQPHGAFLGAGGEGENAPFPWFLVGLYILAGLFFAALSAHQAFHRGENPAVWFGIGLFFNVAGYLLLLARPRREIARLAPVPRGLGKVAATRMPRACPACGAMNHPAAEKCAGCGKALQPLVESEVKRAAAE